MSQRVCHVSTVHLPSDTRVFQKECRSLAKAGYDVHLVIQGNNEVRDGVMLHGLRKPANRLDRMVGLVGEALDQALALDAELYHLHDPELLRIARQLKLAGKRVVFDSHEFYRYQLVEKPYLPRPVSKAASAIYSLYETKVCRQIDAVIIPCTRLDENPFAGRARLVETIDNYPIISEKSSQLTFERSSRDAICYVGGLTYNRGITHLVRAAYRAGVRAILAGPMDSTYQKELESMPEYACVDYRGVVDHSGVEEIIGESFCGIAALLDVGQYWLGDNLPTKAYEYMAGGIPFIMSPTPYAKKFVSKYPCCMLVNPEDIDAYSEAIMMLQTNLSVAKNMADVGYESLVERFNWEHEAKKLVRLYERLLG